MSEVILVTAPEYSKAEGEFRLTGGYQISSVANEEQLLAEAVLAHRCRAVIVGVDRYGGPLYEALGKIGGQSGAIIARFGVGHDGIDKALARKHNIVVTNTPGVLDQSVAEHTIWLIGAMARNIASSHEEFRTELFASQTGSEMAGKTLGIVGLGAIGRRVARISHFGFGMPVLAADCLAPDKLAANDGKSFEEVKRELGLEHYTQQADEVFAQADVVSIHLPAIEATRHFVNAQRLGLMRPGAMLVNTSRGWVLDEDALFDALVEGRIAGAALDVFENEPYRPVSPEKDLRTLKNIVLTPHIGSNTHEANGRMARACLGNLSGFFAGRLDEMTRVDTIA